MSARERWLDEFFFIAETQVQIPVVVDLQFVCYKAEVEQVFEVLLVFVLSLRRESRCSSSISRDPQTYKY